MNELQFERNKNYKIAYIRKYTFKTDKNET